MSDLLLCLFIVVQLLEKPFAYGFFPVEFFCLQKKLVLDRNWIAAQGVTKSSLIEQENQLGWNVLVGEFE